MIRSILTTIFVAFIGNIVASTFQKRAFHYQNIVRNCENEALKIIEITSKINELAHRRIFFSERLVQELQGTKPLNVDDEIRQKYRDAVAEWNIGLATINIELNDVKLYRYARNELEPIIHKKFRYMHKLLNDYFQNKM